MPRRRRNGRHRPRWTCRSARRSSRDTSPPFQMLPGSVPVRRRITRSKRSKARSRAPRFCAARSCSKVASRTRAAAAPSPPWSRRTCAPCPSASTTSSASGDSLLPGNRVDVLGSRDLSNREAPPETILQNVRVLAVDQTASTEQERARRGARRHPRSDPGAGRSPREVEGAGLYPAHVAQPRRRKRAGASEGGGCGTEAAPTAPRKEPTVTVIRGTDVDSQKHFFLRTSEQGHFEHEQEHSSGPALLSTVLMRCFARSCWPPLRLTSRAPAAAPAGRRLAGSARYCSSSRVS